MKKNSVLSVASADTDKKVKKSDEADGVNIEQLSSAITHEIKEVFRVFGGDDVLLDAKPTLEILMDIESRFHELTETIIFVCKNNPVNQKIVQKLEQKRKNVYKEEQLKQREIAAVEAADKQKAELETRQKKQSKPVGKPRMVRSQKPNVKQKIVVKKMDEDTMDQHTYLGFDFESLAATAAVTKGADGKN